MNNIVKLVQASGKAIVIPATAIAIVRTLEPAEKDKTPNGRSGVWLILGGVAQHAVVRESFGFILRKAGGNSGERIQIAGMGDTKISMPRDAFAHAIEGERITDAKGNIVAPQNVKNGEEVLREDATTIQTTLHGNGGPVAFFVKETAADLHEMLNTDVSEDDSAEDEDDAPEAEVKPAKPSRGKGAAKAA
jgi:hypothetical protein